MDQEILKLREAQRIDLEIDKLKRLKRDYPQQIETLKQEVASLEQSLNDTIESIRKREVNSGTIETEIAAEREKLTGREERLLVTKTNKEYTAVQHEIVQSRERIDSLETEHIETMTALDELRPKKDELAASLETATTGNAEKIADIQERFDSIESDIAALAHQRDEALTGIEKRILSVYMRLRKGKGGIAITTVDPVRHACRGCHKQLPPQNILELRRNDKIMFCENCGRIMIWEEEE